MGFSHKKLLSSFTVVSICIGVFITAITGFLGPRCDVAPPGGVNNGWRGLPIPYYQCGTWGDTYYNANQCIQGKIQICEGKNEGSCTVSQTCILDTVAFPVLIILIDIAFWTGIACLIMKKYKK